MEGKREGRRSYDYHLLMTRVDEDLLLPPEGEGGEGRREGGKAGERWQGRER